MARKLTTTLFVEQAIKVHGSLYNYSLTRYVNAFTNIVIICSEHGRFSQRPNHHTQGSGCPYCSVKKTTKMFISDAKESHGNRYDYSLVSYTTRRGYVKIRCKHHGVFTQIARNHLRGQGCPHCNHYISKQETAFLDYLKIPTESRQKYIASHKVDGIDSKKKTIYEFLGDYWHGNPERFDRNEINIRRNITYGELHNRTLQKLHKLKAAGFRVKYIWESAWKRFLRNQNKRLELLEI
jgi:hypothetical protein